MVNYTLIPQEIMDHSKGKFMRKGMSPKHFFQIQRTSFIVVLTISHCRLSEP